MWKVVFSLFLFVSSLQALQAYQTALGVPPEAKWAQKDVDRSLVFTQTYDVEVTFVQEKTGSLDNICAGINSQNWQTLWSKICASPQDLSNQVPYTTGTPLPIGSKVAFGTVQAGQRLGFKIQAPGGDGFYEVCTNPALNNHTTGNLALAYGGAASWYVDSGYSHWVLFSIPDQPDYLIMIAEDYLVSFPGAFTWDMQWTANFDDQIIMVKCGAANVQASLANQGFNPALVVDSVVDKLITTMLDPVQIAPVPDTFVAFSSQINTPVTVSGSPASYGADALPQNTVYKLTSVQSQPSTTVPSGKYVSKLKAWNRRSSAERQVNIRVNYPPVANAGLAEKVGVGTVNLDASGSNDQDTDQVLKFKWTQVEGPVVAIADPSQKVTSCKVNKIGTYKFRVEASDGMNTSTADKVVTVIGPWANLLVTHVEIRGTLDSSAKVETYVNGNLANRSQKVWWYRFPVAADGEYICNIEAKEKGTTKVLDSKLVTVLVGDVYGQQSVDLEKGKGQKPPTASIDF